MAKIDKLIRVLDIPAPQVRIEARIVEANASFSETFGISLGGRWLRASQAAGGGGFKPLSNGGFGGGTLPDGGWNTTGQFGSFNPATAVTGFVEAIIANTSGSFALDVQIAAQEKRGRGRVLSSPSISVEDNSPALIRAGQEVAITTCSGNSCTVTTKEATLSLSITPQITADGNVAMNIDLTNDKLDFANLTAANGASVIPIFRRAAKTRLKVRDGDTAVIGGVSITTEGISQTGVPILSHIPILGWLFKNRTRSRDNTEILIFITPKILR
jgi:type IV pilus assembly protein PilQ